MVTQARRRIENLLFLVCMMLVLSAWARWPFSAKESLNVSGITFDEQTYPVVILGGGMAGLTAADYCLQANIPCLVIEGPMPGGALGQAHAIRNWPGIIQAPGASIVGDVRKQAQANGLKMLQEKVVAVDFKQWPRIIKTQNINDPSKTNTIKALSVIIAMGTDQKFLDIPGESGSDGYWGKGVGKCCVCEGPLCKDKIVGIVGGGEGAIRDADCLATIARKITIFVRGSALDVDIKDLKAKERVLKNPNIEIMYNTEVTQMVGDGSKLTGVKLFNNTTKQHSEFPVEKLFLAIGSKPNTGIFKGHLALTDRGFICLKDRRESSVRGVHAGGDVSDPEFVQAVTASSDGCKSALQAITFLKSIDFDIAMLPKSMHIVQDLELLEQAEKGISGKQDAGKPGTTSSKIAEVASLDALSNLLASTTNLVIVDIYSPMCTSCQKMMPIVDQLAESFGDKVAFAKVNASEKALDLDQVMAKVGGKPMETLPTFMIIKVGKEIDRVVGETTLEEFKKKIEALL